MIAKREYGWSWLWGALALVLVIGCNKAAVQAKPENGPTTISDMDWDLPIDFNHIKCVDYYIEAPTMSLACPPNHSVLFYTVSDCDVHSVADGVVSSVINFKNSTGVIVRRGEYYFTYSCLVNVAVAKGEHVKRGQTIGTFAPTGATESMEFVVSRNIRLIENPIDGFGVRLRSLKCKQKTLRN